MENPFVLLNVPVALIVDKNQLDHQYQNLQKRLHPDVQTDPLQRQAAAVLAANVAKAYDQIQDPLYCLQFLLHSRNESLENIEQEKNFLMDLLQLQEQIEDERDLETLYAELNVKVKKLGDEISRLYEEHVCFKKEALMFSYLFKILNRLSSKVR